MSSTTNIYFASDLHLGAPNASESLVREKMMVKWLDKVAEDAAEIYLLGDLFDFWFEYKHAIPKGYTRILGKISELCDRGIQIHLFTGNHDMWIFDYLPKETGVILHREPIRKEWEGIKFYIGHGDGLGPGDYGYKFIKKIFASKICQWLFARLHPNLGISIANFWSRKSRIYNADSDKIFLGNEKEWLVVYSKEVLKKEFFDYFIFGHRHLPLEIDLGSGSTYVNTGDWITHFTYAHFDGKKLHLKKED